MAGAQQPRRGRAVVAGGSAALGLLLGGAAARAGAHADADAGLATLSDASTGVRR